MAGIVEAITLPAIAAAPLTPESVWQSDLLIVGFVLCLVLFMLWGLTSFLKRKLLVERIAGGQIEACMRCGSRDLTHSLRGLRFHNLQGAPSVTVACNSCGWMGLPILLEDENAHSKFMEEIGKDPDRLAKVSGCPPIPFMRRRVEGDEGTGL